MTLQEKLNQVRDSVESAHKMICKLALDSNKFSMSIPPQDCDSDMVLQKPLDELNNIITALEKAVCVAEVITERHEQYGDDGRKNGVSLGLYSIAKASISDIKKLLGVE